MSDEHKGLPVPGYTPQSEANVDLGRESKEIEELVLRQIDLLEAENNRWRGTSRKPPFDPRWLAIARTQIEQGFMALNRAIFKPKRAPLQDDDPDPAPMVAPAKPTQHATASTSSPAAPTKETATMSDTPEELAQEAIRAGTVAYFVDPIGWAEGAAPHLGTAVYLTRATEQAECLEGLVRHASRAIGREYIGASFFDKTGPAAPEDWRVLRDALAEANRTAALAAAATWAAKEALDRYRCAIGEITPDLD